jgi:hypothetical protein
MAFNLDMGLGALPRKSWMKQAPRWPLERAQRGVKSPTRSLGDVFAEVFYSNRGFFATLLGVLHGDLGTLLNAFA